MIPQFTTERSMLQSRYSAHPLLVCSMVLMLGLCAMAKDIYVAQASAGTGDGTSSANALSASWFNTSGNWGAGAAQINAGDTIHLCGTITTQLTVLGSGTAGHVITLFFEPNAKLSQPAGTLVDCTGRSYLVFDGGSNGILENTDNGSALGHQIPTTGIQASMCSNLEVKNLTFQNLYVHTSMDDNSLGFGGVGAVYLNNFGNNISIHDCKFRDICWVLTMGGGDGVTNVNIYNNTFENYDHGVAGIGGSMGSPANVNIHHNRFGSTANWDTTTGTYHHDGIHIFFDAGGLLSGVNIHDNLFCGDWGLNNTAHLYVQGDFTGTNPMAVSNMTIWNNVFVQYSANTLNDGFMVGGGPNWGIYNNTFLGSRVRNSTAVFIGGANLSFKNNLITSVTTFVSLLSGASLAPGGFNNNLYADAREGGNSPWSIVRTQYNAFALWQSATGGQEAQSQLVTDAVLNQDGTPLPGSPAMGAGADLSAIFTTDKSGLTRVAPWDIGAFKYVPPTIPSAPKNVRVISP